VLDAKQAADAVRPRRNRRRTGAILALLVLMAICLFAVYQSALFRLERIELTGNQRLTEAQVMGIIQLEPGSSRWANPASLIEARLRTEPRIQGAKAAWAFGVLHIDLQERLPVALLPYQDRFYLALDATGMILEQTQLTAARGLPVLSGMVTTKALRGQLITHAGVLDALTLVAHMLESERKQVDQVRVEPDGSLTLFLTTGGVTVQWGQLPVGGEKDRLIHDKLATFWTLWETTTKEHLTGCSFDLRVEGQFRRTCS
jgi:cell division protein FtsQ